MQIKCVYDVSTATRYLATLELANTTPFPVDLSQTLQPHSCIHRSNQLWLQITQGKKGGTVPSALKMVTLVCYSMSPWQLFTLYQIKYIEGCAKIF